MSAIKELEKILTPEDHVIIYKMTANKYLDIQEFGLEKTIDLGDFGVKKI